MNDNEFLELARSLLAYEPETGKFIHRRNYPKSRKDSVAGSISTYGYTQISIKGKLYLAHRLAWLFVHGKWPKHQIDHINGNRTDNRISNLRDVPSAINAQNKKFAKKDKPHPMGVGQTKYGVWVAQIKINGKSTYIGRYDTQEQALAAYMEQKRKHHKGAVL